MALDGVGQVPAPSGCHVYAADQGLQLQNETVDAVMFDDAALLLLVIKGGVMFAYDVAQDLPTQHEQLVWTYPLQEGPAVVCARCSLDRRLLALQRSRLLVEAVDLPTGNISVCSSDKGRSELLGMFFSEWPDGQLVLLSRGGLELCTLAASRQAWQFLSTGLVTLPPFTLATTALGTSPSVEPTAPSPASLPHSTADNLQSTSPGTGSSAWPTLPVSTHASVRDTQGKNSSGGRAAAAAPQAANRAPAVKAADDAGWKSWTSNLANWVGGSGMAADMLPGPAAAQLASWPNMTAGASMEVVPASAVSLLKMYGRVYCAHVNTATRTLDLYRIFTDTVILQHSFALPSSRVALSVVDNVLVVHQQAICSALLIDVCADGQSPVSSMQVLGHLAPLRRPRQLEEERLQQQRLKRQGLDAAAASQFSGLATPVAWSVVDEDGVALSCSAWQFHLPNLIVDMKTQVVYRLLLDVHTISGDCPSPPTLAAFLQRRRAPRLQVNRLEVLLHSPLATHPAVLNLAQHNTGSPRAASLDAPPSDAFTSITDLQPGSPASGASLQAPGSPVALVRVGGREGSASAHPHSLLHPVMLSGLVKDATTMSKLTLTELAQRVLQEELALPDLRNFYDAVVKAYREVVISTAAGRASVVTTACVVSPAELVQQLQADTHNSDSLTPARRAYLRAASYELSAALAMCEIEQPVELQSLTWQLSLPPSSSPGEAGQAGVGAAADTLPRVLHCMWQQLSRDMQPSDLMAGDGGHVAAQAAAAMLVKQAGEGGGGGGLKAAAGVPAVSYPGSVRSPSPAQQDSNRPRNHTGSPLPTVKPQQGATTSSHTAVHSSGVGAVVSPEVPAAPGVRLVRFLLEQGQVVKAARAARDLRVSGVMPQELIAAAGKVKDVSVLAALYRCFRPALMPQYPTFDALRQAVFK